MVIFLHRRLAIGLFFIPLFVLGGAFGHIFHARHLKAVVTIDPGHGGIDGGCQDSRGNMEKDLNLAVSRRVSIHLERLGVAARLTRYDDRALGQTYSQDLLARLESARKAHALALVSLHANWHYDPAAQGALTVIPPNSPKSAQLARAIIARLTAVRQTNPDPLVMADHGLLAQAPFPIVLVETGFLSNADEAARLQTETYRDALARAIALGIRDYLEPRRSAGTNRG